MLVLGINAFHGDAAAVLLRDGRVVAALEEERFRRVKHWAAFPTLAIRRCLDIAGARGSDIDHIAIGRDGRANFGAKARFVATHLTSIPAMLGRRTQMGQVRGVGAWLAEALAVNESRLPRLHRVEHHPAHLASTFYPSPFAQAACCSIDGFGDFVSTAVGVGRGHRVDVLDRTFFPDSIGAFYTAVTQYLGFPNYGDEFKVMGLAPYGRPEFVRELRQLVRLAAGGHIELDLRFFAHGTGRANIHEERGVPIVDRMYSDALVRLLGPPRATGTPVGEREEHIAHSLQCVFEECVAHVLRGVHARTGVSRLCLAGGCAMNSVMNGKVRSETPFIELYVQPASADSGIALGSALHVWHQVLGFRDREPMTHAYLGTEYPGTDVAALFAERGGEEQFIIERAGSIDAAAAKAAQLIADGNVIGWYQGRMEWGARALGNRSIVADPRRDDMRDIINTRIKFREKFRPFAPSVLEERVGDWFVGAVPDPFMLQVYPVRPERRAQVPAITHVDGSGRLQTVNQATNAPYHRLITEFAALTGVPMVLNTSFNENEPIVDTPAQAVDCFARTRMDVLVVHDTIVRRVVPAPA